MGYGRLKKMVQGKDTLNEKQSLPCWRWCHGLLFFLHQFLRFVLILMLHHSGKIAIPYDHLPILLQILHLVLFNSLQRQGELRMSGDSWVVFWWARDGNRRLSLLRRADLPFVQNGFFAIYFRPSVSKQFPPRSATAQRGLRCCWWKVKTLFLYMALYGRFFVWGDIGMWHLHRIWEDGAQCKCKCWFVF